MSSYKLTHENWVHRLADGARISTADDPLAPNTNPHYLEYKQWLADGNTPEPADPVPVIAEAIAARRYQTEVDGITINGMRVETDDRAKLLINGAAVEAMIDPDYVMQWKTDGGFVELTGAQVIGIARAVRTHVQACFDREAELLEALEAGTLTDEMLDHGWPVA
jgi:hypothetical protein